MTSADIKLSEAREHRKALKEDLEKYIQRKVRAFNNETGMLIDKIVVSTCDSYDNTGQHTSVSVWIEPKL